MRFGLAIGGVLLAVVVVYVIVISGGNKSTQQTAGVGGQGQAVPMSGGVEIATADARTGSPDSAVIPLSATAPPPAAPVTPVATDGGAPAVTIEPPQQGPTVIRPEQPPAGDFIDALRPQVPAGSPTVRP